MDELSIHCIDDSKLALKNYVPAAVHNLPQRTLETEYNVTARDLNGVRGKCCLVNSAKTFTALTLILARTSI